MDGGSQFKRSGDSDMGTITARESRMGWDRTRGPSPRGGGEVIEVVMDKFDAPVAHVGTFKRFDSVKDRIPRT